VRRSFINLLATVLLFALPNAARAAAGNPANVQNNPAHATEFHGSAVFDGGILVNGSVVQNSLGQPAAPTITQTGTPGSTSKTYYCVAEDVNGAASMPSSSGNTTTSNATLSTTNYNNVTCGGLRGAVGYIVLKANTSHQIGSCSVTTGGGYCTVVDNSTSAGSSYTASAQDMTGALSNSGNNRNLLYSGTSAVVSASAASYFPINATTAYAAAAAIGDVESYTPGVVTFRNLYCELTAANGTVTVAGGTNYVIAVDDVTQSATTVTCTIGATASSCSDTTDSYPTTAGDLVAMIITPSGTPTALVPHCQVEEDF
jgi:hypothetical protein